MDEVYKVAGYITKINLLHFCTLTLNYQKDKLRKQSHLLFKSNETPRNESNQKAEQLVHYGDMTCL